MANESTLIPTDTFSRRRRELNDHPGAVGASSTIPMSDHYGNFQSWIVETFRADGQETVFLIVSDADQGRRLMLPPQVTAAIYRHREQLVARGRRQAARQALETKRDRGIDVGAIARQNLAGGRRRRVRKSGRK